MGSLGKIKIFSPVASFIAVAAVLSPVFTECALADPPENWLSYGSLTAAPSSLEWGAGLEGFSFPEGSHRETTRVSNLFQPPPPGAPVPRFDEEGGHFSGGEGPVWSVQFLPDGLIYRSYLAGVKEPRFASQWVHDYRLGWIWDITLGGRVGLLRYGTEDPFRPEGWQLDIEGAGMPRLDMDHHRDLVSADFRFGIPLTYGRGPWGVKLGYYHLSSHLGDEYMVRYPGVERINYSRDVLVLGTSLYCREDLRVYAEAGWAFAADGGSQPWEFQFGIDYSPMQPSGLLGAPFFAINTHLREEVRFGGNLVVQTGWQWRGATAHLFRVGMHYFAGKSDQFEFYNEYEEKLGFGLWYDY